MATPDGKKPKEEEEEEVRSLMWTVLIYGTERLILTKADGERDRINKTVDLSSDFANQ